MSKVAIVTGAGAGIGRAAALALLRGRLFGRPRRPPPGAARGDRRPGRRGQARARSPVPTDVSDPASVRALFAKVKDDVRPRSTCCSTTPASARPGPRSRTSPSSSGRRSSTST